MQTFDNEDHSWVSRVSAPSLKSSVWKISFHMRHLKVCVFRNLSNCHYDEEDYDHINGKFNGVSRTLLMSLI